MTAQLAAARHTSPRGRQRLVPVAIALGGYALSQVLAVAAGVRVLAGHLEHGWPLLDLSWLRADLLGSIWHLHTQPPLHNLAVGLATIVAPGREAALLWGVTLVLGAGATAALADLLGRLGVRAWLAVTATLLAVASPAFIVWQYDLGYTWSVTVMLIITAWALAWFGEQPSAKRAVAAFILAGLPGLTWSLFHFGYLIILAVALAIVARPHARRIAAAVAIPLVLTAGLHVKNLAVFGDPSISSWAGQNVFRVVSRAVPDDELSRLVADGRVRPVALVKEFSPLSAYAGLVEMPPPAGRPELDEVHKQDGSINYNNQAYVGVSRAYLGASADLLRARPTAYPRAVISGACVYLNPATDYWASVDNVASIRTYARLYETAVYGLFTAPPQEAGCRLRFVTGGEFPLLLPVLLVAAFGGSVWIASRSDRPLAVRSVAVFAAVTIAWVTLVGNVAESGENNRFRFLTEPLMWVPLAVLAQGVIDRWKRRRHGTA